MGPKAFYTELFATLGLDVDEATGKYLQQVDDWRAKRIASRKTASYRRKRNKRMYDKILSYHAELKKDREKNQFYETCSALNDDVPGDVAGNNEDKPQSRAKKRQKKDSTETTLPIGPRPAGCKEDNYCKTCMQWGHKRKSSRLCLMNKSVTNEFPSSEDIAAMTEEEQQRTQLNVLDCIALTTEDSDDSSRNESTPARIEAIIQDDSMDNDETA
ncbi:hypothetical protein SEMRO_1182_G250010.1 [Seminavis robusta]|uniref:Uncharacterized protein n=1 Tax=Seminavis robusta TaxID=568900 RepID=A0A9N8EGW0_9STRA|nr:hypothetical protein SEMRO_1182_G250010.1 [Seminavis robusta]|eukprot:Sro1182_g250010.1 n/a (215) ;mRNA; f:32925-33569